MFQSATIKLTGWYLLILMVISILFSFAIFEVTMQEVSSRLERFESNLQISPRTIRPLPLAILRSNEIDVASINIVTSLVAANFLILIIGGGVSYLFARKTLKPIKESHEAQSRFTSDASHELRTPLAVIKTEIEVALRDKNATKKDLAEVMKSSLEEVDKLTSLSQMLLNLSRLDHGKLKKTPLNLRTVTNQVIKRYNVGDDRIKIKSSSKVIALGNEPAINELVTILVENSIKYSPKDSLILINITYIDDSVSFEIINSGQGIEKERLPYIFDRFYRADSSRTHREGYGLGLSLAKKIVELSDGELTATSTPGQSTIFNVILPKYQSKLNRK